MNATPRPRFSPVTAASIRNTQRTPNGNPVQRVVGNGRQTCVVCLHPVDEGVPALRVGQGRVIHGKDKFCGEPPQA